VKSSYKQHRSNFKKKTNLDFSILTVWGWEENISKTPVNLGESYTGTHTHFTVDMN